MEGLDCSEYVAVTVTGCASKPPVSTTGGVADWGGTGVVEIFDVKVTVSGIMGTDPRVLLMGCGVSTVTTGVPERRDGYSVTVVTVVLPEMKAV